MFIQLTDDADVKVVQGNLQALGLWTTAVRGVQRGAWSLEVAPHSAHLLPEDLVGIAGVAEVLAPPSRHPRVDQQAGCTVPLAGVRLGPAEAPVLMAGPCSVESEEAIHLAAAMVAACGGHLLRGGAFKPRTSPYSFAGHGRQALGWLQAAAAAHNLGVVTEVLSEADVPAVAEVADLLQIGSRNMQNFALLRAVGAAGRPVLLKRGMASTVDAWLLAGEHVLAAGAQAVIFCERGIQSFDPCTRNLLDLAAVALLREVYGQPVLVDPSHAVGRRDLILPVARAARAAGADGLLVEAHPNPETAMSDGAQALDAAGLAALAENLS